MAKGRAWRNRLVLLLAVSTFTLLIVADIMPNPFPGIWDWINRERPLAAEVTWQERLAGRVDTAGLAGDRLAVDAGRRAQLREWTSGHEAVDWTADWLTVAGAGPDAVVITGEAFSRGYEVRDPGTGAVIHTDEEARAVWGFDQLRLDLRCDGPRSCELRAYLPDAAQPLWRAHLPGADSGLLGAEPELAMPRVSAPTRVHERVGGPQPVPPLLGVPINRHRIAVVDSRTGEVLEQPEAAGDELFMTVGKRVVRAVATRRDGVCQLAVSAYDPVTREVVWGPLPYNLRTITGGGCEQEYAAAAAGAALVAVDADGSELVLDANDGRVLWRGEPDERVQGLTEHLAVVQAADPTIRYGVQLGRPDQILWEQRVHQDADLIVAGCGVLVADREPNRLTVWHATSGEELLEMRTSATALACGTDGLVLASGRSVGFAPFDGAPGDEAPGGTK